jgi:hypothetical protein
MKNQEKFYNALFEYQRENRGETPGSAFMYIDHFIKLKEEIFKEVGYFGHVTREFPNNTISLRGITIIPIYDHSDEYEIYFSAKPFKFK